MDAKDLDEFYGNEEEEVQEEQEDQQQVEAETETDETPEEQPKASVSDVIGEEAEEAEQPSGKPESVPFNVYERDRDKYKRRAQEAEARLKELEQPQNTPTEADNSGIDEIDDDEFLTAKQWKQREAQLEQRIQARIKAEQEQQRAQEQQKQLQAKAAKAEEDARKRHSDYDDLMRRMSKLNLSEAVRKQIREADDPAEAAYKEACEIFGIQHTPGTPPDENDKPAETDDEDEDEMDAVLNEIGFQS